MERRDQLFSLIKLGETLRARAEEKEWIALLELRETFSEEQRRPLCAVSRYSLTL